MQQIFKKFILVSCLVLIRLNFMQRYPFLPITGQVAARLGEESSSHRSLFP
jgi:hypothetical protein